jgi:outer membrane protein OmpA-like peptidoglycan-associated protein
VSDRAIFKRALLSFGAWLGATLIASSAAQLVAQSVAEAQGTPESFRLNRFRSAERPDDAFGVRRLGEFGHVRFGANAVLDYANDPLVIRRNQNTGSELASVVDHQLTLKLDLSLALWDRLILLAGFDAPVMMDGPDLRPSLGIPEADSAGFGDVSLGARVRLVGDTRDVFGLGVQAVAILPTAGSSQTYRGEDGVAVRPELIAEVRTRPVRLSANVGVLARSKIEYVDRQMGSELTYGLAVGVPVHERIELLGEFSGGFDFEHFAAKTSTGLEWLLGAKANTENGFYFGAGAGTGFTRGIGTPDARVLAQLGYLTPVAQQKEPVEKAASDRDQDGVLDSADTCPDQPEDRDGHGDDDGCPDPDNDGDAIVDASDSCANEPEDRDGYADDDGCPDPDNDGDGTLDLNDACPNEPGPPDTRGCKAQVKVESEGGAVRLEGVQFENNKDTILPQSYPILETVQSTLAQHSEIKTLRIEGHTDGVGAAPYNMKLSRARTSSVVSWLTSHGVAGKRLEAWACGELYLIADDATAEGRAKNRRVEFSIIDPAPEGADVARKKGCTKVETK